MFTRDPEGWVLKGGQALLVRYPAQARNSRDLDLYRPDASSIQEAVEAMLDAAALDLHDCFSFALTKQDVHANPAFGAKLSFRTFIGVRQVGDLSVDLVTHRVITGSPSRVRISPVVPLQWPADWPTVSLYPLAWDPAGSIWR